MARAYEWFTEGIMRGWERWEPTAGRRPGRREWDGGAADGRSADGRAFVDAVDASALVHWCTVHWLLGLLSLRTYVTENGEGGQGSRQARERSQTEPIT